MNKKLNFFFIYFCLFVWLKAYFNLKKNNRKSSSIIEEEKRQTVMKEEKKIVENVFNFWLLLKLKKKNLVEIYIIVK